MTLTDEQARGLDAVGVSVNGNDEARCVGPEDGRQWPALGRIIAEQIGTDPVEGERLTAESYRTRLY